MTVPLLASFALLQTAPSSSLTPTLFIYAAMFAIVYFVLLRPQQKQKRIHQELVNNLKKGDEVVTAGGIIGEVVHISQQTKDGAAVSTLGDRITIKSGESRLIIERGRIVRVISGTTPAT
jgi:preprotein translocase subunit YajC